MGELIGYLNAGGWPQTLAILYLLWRLDRRLFKLEVVLRMRREDKGEVRSFERRAPKEHRG